MNPWWRLKSARQISALRILRSCPLRRAADNGGDGAAQDAACWLRARERWIWPRRAACRDRASFACLVYRNNPAAASCRPCVRIVPDGPACRRPSFRPVDVRLAAACAAAASGRCVLAKRHLAQITGDMTTLWQSRRRDSLLASCNGPWQRRVVLDIITGYRPSLSDRARHAEMRLEPGSRLHGVCARLRGLCDPAR